MTFVYILSGTIILLIMSFFTSRWKRLQIDFFSASIGLLIAFARPLSDFLSSPDQAPDHLENISYVPYFIFIFGGIQIMFAIPIFFLSARQDQIFTRIYDNADSSTFLSNLSGFSWVSFFQSTAIFLSFLIYHANVSLVLRANELIGYFGPEPGAVQKVLLTMYVPAYFPLHYYPIIWSVTFVFIVCIYLISVIRVPYSVHGR